VTALLEVDAISVSFDGFKAIDGLSLAVEATGLRAIIGPNGAGKTTFMDIVTGRTRPDRGRVLWMGRDLAGLSESRRAREGIGPQVPAPYRVRGAERGREPRPRAAATRARPFGSSCRAPHRGDRDARRGPWPRRWGSWRHLRRRAGELSHGQKQWLEIGHAARAGPPA
jgi:urea transport system ATP-binding protein